MRLHTLVPGSVFTLKLALALFDFATCLVLVAILRRLGRAPGAVVIYAWNPLAVKEIAGSGHIDALMVFFLVLAVFLMLTKRRRLGLLAYGLAILSKLTPVLLVGLFLRRTRPRDWSVLALVVAAGYLPHLHSWLDVLRGLQAMARDWGLQSRALGVVEVGGGVGRTARPDHSERRRGGAHPRRPRLGRRA